MKFNQQIYDEASEWFTRMRDGEDGPGVRQELMLWLRRSPEHVSAYLDIAAVWMGSKSVAADADIDLTTRIAQAREDLRVTELPRAESSGAHIVSSARRARGLWSAAGNSKWIALAATVVIAVLGVQLYDQRNVYSTGVGEQHSLSLPDGSTLELNAMSKVRTRFTREQRIVELVQGQALFRVAKDPARPFIVDSNGTLVRAVGTEFDVYRKPDRTTITVIEGRVAVLPVRAGDARGKAEPAVAPSPPDKDPRLHPDEVMLSAGEQLRLEREPKPAAPVRVNVATATAWTQRQLVFEFTPLAEVAEEFNRYNTRELIIEGESLRALKVSAIFRSADPASLVRYVRTQPGVRVRESADSIWIGEK